MNDLALEGFERRAKEAEERLARIEKKIASKSGGGLSDEKLSEVLTVLYDVRSALGAEKVKSQNSARKQDALENQVKKLEEENSKLRYQVLHLKRNLESHLNGS
ncbi:hypothetical protein HOP50_01g03970 [Chloropicon primus]|uniref:Uncharacterized protein n=1 Tax=Chloropicon primus TaxID=1764295 RepID=A0A5B8MCM5_9CHLO|nr:hypothetical protein A3770_01p04090 [Chloropicon primus]UPQ97106.1 hypothetical protein HOP50_01g03970 [Chloropicon primus]|mmetsp:Transcript_14225/g.40370  ORF Transcript_14225/g.40370 Transcript_14225/m.40370 type:complete len:104 (+) Transcript_14225:1035-1346(+)|eukprot:QDZ17891.1 hypothetical protein A3770_01p04090 [Chloropicon primus]